MIAMFTNIFIVTKTSVPVQEGLKRAIRNFQKTKTIKHLQPTKLITTTATHMVTSIIFLNRHVTLWTLFRMTFIISTIGGKIFRLHLFGELVTGQTFMPR